MRTLGIYIDIENVSGGAKMELNILYGIVCKIRPDTVLQVAVNPKSNIPAVEGMPFLNINRVPAVKDAADLDLILTAQEDLLTGEIDTVIFISKDNIFNSAATILKSKHKDTKILLRNNIAEVSLMILQDKI